MACRHCGRRAHVAEEEVRKQSQRWGDWWQSRSHLVRCWRSHQRLKALALGSRGSRLAAVSPETLAIGVAALPAVAPLGSASAIIAVVKATVT